jgi:CheY-like chemotaxis protein
MRSISAQMESGVDMVTQTVLIVEDDVLNRKIAGLCLDKAAIPYHTVENGREALASIESGNQYAAIFMDCHMPVMDGFTATKYIREWEKEHSVRRTPIYAFTADTAAADKRHCLQSGMDGCLAKPQGFTQLSVVYAQLFANNISASCFEEE